MPGTMKNLPDPTDKAIRLLYMRRTFPFEDRNLTVACLIREADRRPLRAPWWRKKDVSIIGVDLDGNFFLRHCDGGVRYWDHKTQTDTIIAKSVREFFNKLVEAREVEPYAGSSSMASTLLP